MPPRPTRVLASLVAIALAGAVACTSAESGSDPGPAANSDRPPWGLDAAPLPQGQADIDAVLAAMPGELEGLTATVEGNEIGYGASGMGEVSGSMETFLRIMTVGGDEFGAGAPFIEAIVQNGGIQIEGQDLDPASSIVYVAGITPAGGTDYASMMWAEPDSRFVMLIQGTSPDQRQLLVDAYIAASDVLA